MPSAKTIEQGAKDLHDLVMAGAKAGVSVIQIPLDLFAEFSVCVPRQNLVETEDGPYIKAAGGAIKVMPVTNNAIRTFETVDEVLAFVEAHKEV